MDCGTRRQQVYTHVHAKLMVNAEFQVPRLH